VPLLEKILRGKGSEEMKERALFVLAQSGSPRARQLIADVARGNAHPDLQEKALHYLGVFGGRENRQLLDEIYRGTSNVQIKEQVLQSYMIAGDRERVLEAARSEKSVELRAEAAHQLGVMVDELLTFSALEAGREIRPQPGVRLELEGVGRLVQCDPRAERGQRDAECLGRQADVLLDEQEAPRCRFRGQQREVVLAEHALAHEPEQDAELAGRDPSIGERHRGDREAAADRHDLIEQVVLELADERGERGGVGTDPAGPIDHAGTLDDARQLRTERGRQRGHDPVHRRGVLRFRGAQLLVA